jgi:cullin-4
MLSQIAYVFGSDAVFSRGQTRGYGGVIQVERELDESLSLFRLIKDKDVFEAFYKKDLGHRLLTGRSESMDGERSMLSKLKHECGAEFTLDLECMLKDMEISKDLLTLYLEGLKEKDIVLPFDFDVNILKGDSWPLQASQSPCRVPHDMSKALDSYKEFYTAKHESRLLTWQHSAEYCTLKAHYPKVCVYFLPSFIPMYRDQRR